MFDRRLEVVRHSGGQSDRVRVGLLHPLMFRLQPCERAIRLPIQRRDTHQPNQFQCVGGVDLRADFVDRAGIGDIDPATRHITVEADLDVNAQRYGPSPLVQRPLHGPIEHRHHAAAADRVRGMRPAGKRAGLVALDGADHVPVPLNGSAIRLPRAVQQPLDIGDLGRRFLVAGFTEVAASQPRQNRDIGCRKEFGNRQELNVVEFAAGRLGGRREP